MFFLTKNQISKVRYGFSTNSSSYHSIIYHSGKKDLSFLSDPKFDLFEWDWFLQSTPSEKNNYFRSCAFIHYLGMKLSDHEAFVLANHHFPCDDNFEKKRDKLFNYYDKIHVDHQSFGNFPKPHLPNQTLEDLFIWIKKNIINNPNIYILGGNDNSSEEDDPLDGIPNIKVNEFSNNCFTDNFFFKIDPQGFLTLFNPSDYHGPKLIRTKINDKEDPKFGFYPDLIDIKITDYCAKGCKYCYQGSTTKGQHGNADFFAFGEYLRKLGIFEVALGGGEPTSHPEFSRILKRIKTDGVIPNFSTQSFEWMKFDDIREAVLTCCKSVAFSTNEISIAKKWIKLSEQYEIPNPKFHYVLGINPVENLYKFVETLIKETYRPDIILLSFKDSGRGKQFQKYDHSTWTDIARKLNEKYNGDFILGIDSFLVDDVKNKMPEIETYLYDYSDGNFSFYWDIVQNKFAEHSADPSLLFSIDDQPESVIINSSRNDLRYDNLLKAWNTILKKRHLKK